MESIYSRIATADPDIHELAELWPLVTLLDLPDAANIVVAGAYEGRAMELLAVAYPNYGRLVGFDPQVDALIAAALRLRRYPNVTLEPYGLGIEDATLAMGEHGSHFAGFIPRDAENSRTAAAAAPGDLREATLALTNAGLARIDLMLLNVEGYEFLLLPHLLRAGWFAHGAINRLALQLHWGVGYDETFAGIAAELEITHKRVFDELPNWGYWAYSG